MIKLGNPLLTIEMQCSDYYIMNMFRPWLCDVQGGDVHIPHNHFTCFQYTTDIIYVDQNTF